MRLTLRNVFTNQGLVLGLLAILLLAALLAGCGGSSGTAQFDNPGSLTFEKEVASDGSAFDLADPSSVIKISVPAGAVATGQKAKLQVWSGQRNVVKLKNWTQTPVATDLVIAPGALGAHVLEVEMVGGSSTGLGKILTLFGPDGKRFALPQVAGVTLPALRGQLTAKMIAYVANTSATSLEPVRVQLVVENANVGGTLTPTTRNKPTLETVWEPEKTRTSYASKKRIAIYIAGMLEPSDNPAMTSFLSNMKHTDKAASDQTFPYDKIDRLSYDWRNSIESTSGLMVGELLNKYGDRQRFEVDIYAHGEGGLVARYAIEQNGLPSVKRIYCFGVPQQGYKHSVLEQLLLQFGSLDSAQELGLLIDGLAHLLETKEVFETLRTSTTPEGVTYYGVSGTASQCVLQGQDVGTPLNVMYDHMGVSANDGLVSQTSALFGPRNFGANPVHGHQDLVSGLLSSYIPDNTAGTGWVLGANRKIKTLTTDSQFESVLVGSSTTVELNAFDLDGDKMDADILFDPAGASRNAALRWSVGNSTIVRLTSSEKLKVTVLGLKAGETTITATDPVTNTAVSFTFKVLDGNVLVLPNKPELALNESKRFTVGMVTGDIPTGTIINWTLQGDGTINGGKTVSSTAAFVDYLAPNIAVTDKILVELRNPTTNNLIGSTSTSIKVGASFRITPNGKVVPSGGFQQFSVEPIGTASLPVGGSYKWTVSGGTLASATTTVPNVFYTAPSTQSEQTISVDVLKGDGTSAGTASASMLIRPGGIKFTVANINTFMDSDIPNGNYDDPLFQAVVGNVGDVDRIGLTFFVNELTVGGETPGLAIQLAIPVGSKLSAGQTFTVGQVDVAGRFYVIGTTIYIRPGTFTINTVTPNADGTYKYTFSISLNAWIDNTATTEATILTGTGSFTIAY